MNAFVMGWMLCLSVISQEANQERITRLGSLMDNLQQAKVAGKLKDVDLEFVPSDRLITVKGRVLNFAQTKLVLQKLKEYGFTTVKLELTIGMPELTPQKPEPVIPARHYHKRRHNSERNGIPFRPF